MLEHVPPLQGSQQGLHIRTYCMYSSSHKKLSLVVLFLCFNSEKEIIE